MDDKLMREESVLNISIDKIKVILHAHDSSSVFRFYGRVQLVIQASKAEQVVALCRQSESHKSTFFHSRRYGRTQRFQRYKYNKRSAKIVSSTHISVQGLAQGCSAKTRIVYFLRDESRLSFRNVREYCFRGLYDKKLLIILF